MSLSTRLVPEAPAAARVVVRRGGHEFVGVALFREYAQTKRDGALMAQWATRPAGMLAKCAEALALRKAFPLDLAGIYTDDEMTQARSQRRASEGGGLSAALAADPEVEVAEGELVEESATRHDRPGGAVEGEPKDGAA